MPSEITGSAKVNGERRQAYFNALSLRLSEAGAVTFLAAQFRDGQEPSLNNCHSNVERWVQEHPDCGRVAGWFITLTVAGGIIFEAHSVVRLADNSLTDITPLSVPWRPHFLAHTGNLVEFDSLLPESNQQFWQHPTFPA